MAWNDGIDRAANYIISSVNWNDLLGAAGSLMQLKNHAHGGTTGEGSTSIGPLVQEDFTDAVAPAAPGAGKTRLYTVAGIPRYRAGAAGTDRQIITDESAASGDLAGTYPSPTLAKITLGSDADGDIYYRSGGVLARLAKGTALQQLRMNAGATAPEWGTASNTTASALLGIDVTFSVTAGVFVDGPSVSLAAGTWLICAWATINNAGQSQYTGKLWDGTTAVASQQGGKSAAGSLADDMPWSVMAIVTLGGTTTYKVSFTSSSPSSGNKIKAATDASGAGNNATGIVAVKVA